MKKIIGYIAAHSCFSIGATICKISYIKRRGEFLFDRPKLMPIGMWLASNYQRFMHYSHIIQEWADIKTPWTKVIK